MGNLKKKYKYEYTFKVGNWWNRNKVVSIFGSYGRIKRIGKDKFIINTDELDFPKNHYGIKEIGWWRR